MMAQLNVPLIFFLLFIMSWNWLFQVLWNSIASNGDCRFFLFVAAAAALHLLAAPGSLAIFAGLWYNIKSTKWHEYYKYAVQLSTAKDLQRYTQQMPYINWHELERKRKRDEKEKCMRWIALYTYVFYFSLLWFSLYFHRSGQIQRSSFAEAFIAQRSSLWLTNVFFFRFCRKGNPALGSEYINCFVAVAENRSTPFFLWLDFLRHGSIIETLCWPEMLTLPVSNTLDSHYSTIHSMKNTFFPLLLFCRHIIVFFYFTLFGTFFFLVLGVWIALCSFAVNERFLLKYFIFILCNCQGIVIA